MLTISSTSSLSSGYLDVQTLALDFLSLGFRECMTEVSRYLGAVEGLDTCDPLQARLLSHLTSAALTITSHRLPPQPPPFHPHHWAAAAAVIPPLYGLNVFSPAPDAGGAPQRLIELCQPSSTVSSSSSPPSTSVFSPTTSLPVNLSGLPILPSSPTSQPTSSSTSRPYRPWGTEVGAFWLFGPNGAKKDGGRWSLASIWQLKSEYSNIVRRLLKLQLTWNWNTFRVPRFSRLLSKQHRTITC